MQLTNMNVGNGQPLFVIAGPCVIESESMIMNTAQTLKKVGEEPGIGLIFKSSLDKPTILLSTAIVDLPFTACLWQRSPPSINPIAPTYGRWLW